MKGKNTIQKLAYIVCALCMIFSLWEGKAINAASASVAFSSSKEEYAVGESFIVTLTAESSSGISGIQTYVAYDPNVLELTDVGKCVSGENGLILISDLEGEEQVREYHMKFMAKKAATTEVYVSDTVHMYSGQDSKQMSVSQNTLPLHIVEQQSLTEQQVENKGLKSLEVSYGQLTPAFSADVTQYEVEVESDVNILYIEAKAVLAADVVTVQGNENLQEGENQATITVSGSKKKDKVYTIKIYKNSTQEEVLEEETEKVEEAQIGNRNSDNNGITFYSEDGTLHMNYNLDFEIVPIPDTTVIPNGYVQTLISVEGQDVIAYAPKDNLGDYVLVYGRKQDGEAKFYQYDRVGQWISSYEGDDLQNVEVHTSAYEKKESSSGFLYGVIGALVVIIVILLSMLLRKRKNGYEDDYEEEFEEDE